MTNRDADFDAWVARARAMTVLEEIERRGIRLRREGAELVGPCPVCGGKDRFSVNGRRNLWNCRKGDRGGDAIALVQYLDGADFLAACETLTGEAPPRGEGTRASPEELAAREEARRAKEAESEAKAEGVREAERVRLYRMWTHAQRHAQPVADYFCRRGIRLPAPFCARFLPREAYYHGNDANGRRRMLHRGPAMLLPITDEAGDFRGLHITWLDPSTRKGKAEIIDPDTGELLPAKKVRGSKKGNRILLVRASSAAIRQVAGEGPETVMSVYTADLLAGRLRPDVEYVSSVDLGNLCGRAMDGDRVRHPTQTATDKLGRARAVMVPGPTPDLTSPAMYVPETVTHLTLLADGDSDPFTTRCAMERAQARHAAPGRFVTVAWPPEGLDFNDILLGRHLDGSAA